MRRVPPDFKPRRYAHSLPPLGVAAALSLFSLLAAAVYFDGTPYFGWDLAVSRAVQSAPWPSGFETFLRGVSLLGDDVLYSAGLVVAVSLGLLAGRYRREAVVLGLLTATGFATKAVIKFSIGRPRPTPDLVAVLSHPSDYSFPSGHTVHYVVFFGFLWFLTFALVRPRLLRWPLLGLLGALVLLVGLSRVYLGAHWASDVLGGYLLGGALLTTAISGYRWWTAGRGACSVAAEYEPKPFHQGGSNGNRHPGTGIRPPRRRPRSGGVEALS